MNTTRFEDALLASEQEYDSQIAHTIWELERTVKRGRASEATRHALIEAHASQLQLLEKRYGIPSESRSFLLLQQRVAPGVLLLPDENAGCEDLRPMGRFFNRAGFSVFGTSLAYRAREESAPGPQYWQTALDESENRYDMLSHYTSRIAVLGVGFSATLALHLARAKRVSCVMAVFPTFHADVTLRERMKEVLRRVFPRAVKTPPDWNQQRRMATEGAREALPNMGVPLFVVAEDIRDGSERGRSVRTAERLLAERASNLKLVPSAQADTLQHVPEAVLDALTRFLRQH